MNKKLLYIGAVIGIFIILSLFIFFKDVPKENNGKESISEKVVRQYFKSWDKKDYAGMYSIISDGFKEIDPNAKDLESFRNYASSQNINGVTVKKINENLNNGKTAVVSYSVEFIFTKGDSLPYKNQFTLKYRENDEIPGWKLIHPYGENIDNS